MVNKYTPYGITEAHELRYGTDFLNGYSSTFVGTTESKELLLVLRTVVHEHLNIRYNSLSVNGRECGDKMAL